MREKGPGKSDGKIVTTEGKYFSVIGRSRLQVSKEVGETIGALMRIQDKLLELHYKSSVFKIWVMLNCRKTAELIRGHVTLGEVTDPTSFAMRRTSEIAAAMHNDIRDRAGIVQMFKDLDEFIESGRRSVLFGVNDVDAGFLDSDFYNQHWLDSVLVGAEFPQTVHIFEFKSNTPLDVRKRFATETVKVDDFLKLGFTHTFEVLGKGEDGAIHCVHKTGPEPTNKVVIQNSGEFQEWLRFGETKGYDQYELATFVAISGHVDLIN